MAIDSAALHAWLLTHAATVVGSSAVLGFEPKSAIDYAAAGNAVVYAAWLSGAEAVPERSSATATAARVAWTIRAHRLALGEPAVQQATERLLLTAVDQLLAACFGDLRLDANSWFDPRGQTGDRVKADLGYLALDNQLNRVATITIGIVVDDAWPETE